MVENGEYNGVNYGFEKRHPSFPSTFNLGTFSDKVKLKVSKGKSVSITWLQMNEGSRIKGLDNSVSIWEKQYYIVHAGTEDISLEFDSSQWLLNSCVVSEGGQLVDGNYSLVLYSNFDAILGKIKSKLNIPKIEVLTAVDFDYKADYAVSSGFSPGGYYAYDSVSLFNSFLSIWAHSQSTSVSVFPYKNPLFQVVPDSYCFAWIQLANNNFENNSISKGLPDSVLDILCYEDSVSLNSPYYDRPFQKYYREHGYFSTYRDYNISFDLGDFSLSTAGTVTSNYFREKAFSPQPVKGEPILNGLRIYPFSPVYDETNLFSQYDKGYLSRQSYFAMGSLDGTIYEKIGTGWIHPNILDANGNPYQNTVYTPYCWYKHDVIEGHSYRPNITEKSSYISPPPRNNEIITSFVVSRVLPGDFTNQVTNFSVANYFSFAIPHDNDLFESQRIVYAFHTTAIKQDGTLTNTGRLRHEDSVDWYRYNATVNVSSRVVTYIKYQEIDTTNLENEPVISLIDIVSRNEVLYDGGMSVTDDVCINWYDPGWHSNNVNTPPPYGEYKENRSGTNTYPITLKRNLRLFPRQPKILKEVNGINNQRNYQKTSVSHIKEVIDNVPDDEDGITETIFYCFTKEVKPFVIESGYYYVLSITDDGVVPPVVLPSSGRVIIGFLTQKDFKITLFGRDFLALDSHNKAFLFYRENGYWYNNEVNTTMAESPTVKAIGAALGVSQYSKNPVSPGQDRRWNLGAMIHAIAVSQGLNFNANGEIMAPDNSVEYDDGQSVYNRYGTNQAGIAWNDKDAKGKSYGESVPFVGYLYDVITPVIAVNQFTGEPSDLDTGGMVGCPNVPAIIEAFKRDVMKTLGGDESVGVVPSADGLGYGTYEGLASMVTESLYMDSYNSMVAMKTFINSQKGVGMLQEVLRSQGMALETKEFNLTLNGTKVTGIYPGLTDSSPSQLDFIILALIQLAHLLPMTMSAPVPPRKQDTGA